MLSLRRSLVPVILLLTLVFGLGTAGYWLIEGWPLLDSFYMTAITLTTVGFSEVRPLSNDGRLFTIALLFLGVGTAAYGFSAVGEYVLASGLGPRMRRRRMMRIINGLHDHVIVCGYGRVGRSAVATLLESQRKVVVVELQTRLVEELQELGVTVVHGDATRDETLRQAGIERATGLMVCGGSDADNLFIVLSARTLNSRLHIVARCVVSDNESKMRRAGADRVVSPYQIGGRHMANVLLRPHVTEFLDVVTLDSGLELWLEELLIAPDSSLAGQTAIEADLRRRTGVTLVALLRGSSRATLTPDENTRFEPGDELIVLGTREQLLNLERLANGKMGH
ncbi:MAG: potassium channel protein [Chloroflexi bacterium]|nr:potassium channel protein [Chloroflexota bacterium]MCI0581021.1 potassium channel protein [Chloroflexota bacterium]MCI0646360.1 potassium channel protein [Chloroflexota bacterium]MCI0728382.1 potassium channel protein [Chloroflexota bacterium]